MFPVYQSQVELGKLTSVEVVGALIWKVESIPTEDAETLQKDRALKYVVRFVDYYDRRKTVAKVTYFPSFRKLYIDWVWKGVDHYYCTTGKFATEIVMAIVYGNPCKIALRKDNTPPK